MTLTIGRIVWYRLDTMRRFITTISCALALAPAVAAAKSLPVELELCIETARRCIARAEANVCDYAAQTDRDICVANYEDCSYAIPEAHDPHCRLSLVWCELERNAGWSDLDLKGCMVAGEICGEPGQG